LVSSGGYNFNGWNNSMGGSLESWKNNFIAISNSPQPVSVISKGGVSTTRK